MQCNLFKIKSEKNLYPAAREYEKKKLSSCYENANCMLNYVFNKKKEHKKKYIVMIARVAKHAPLGINVFKITCERTLKVNWKQKEYGMIKNKSLTDTIIADTFFNNLSICCCLMATH